VILAKALFFIFLLLLGLVGGCQCQKQVNIQPSPIITSPTPIASATLEPTTTQILTTAIPTPIITPAVTPTPALTIASTPMASATPGPATTEIPIPTATPTPTITPVVTPTDSNPTGPNSGPTPTSKPAWWPEEAKLAELREVTKNLMETMSPPVSGSREDPTPMQWSVFPEGFYGTVTINGSPAPISTTIEARGTDVITYLVYAGIQGNPQTTTESGIFSGLIVVGDIYAGTTISFYINGKAATQTVSFQAASIKQLNLTVGN
jgi:hypothetical protein